MNIDSTRDAGSLSGRRRALYLFCSEKPSGAEYVFERLIIRNAEQVDATVLCPPGPFAKRLQERGVRVITTPSLRSLNREQNNISKTASLFQTARRALQTAALIARVVRKQNIEVVHANNLGAAAYTLLPQALQRLSRGRHIAWLWTTQDKKYLVSRDDHIARLCCRRLDATIVVSQSVADEYPAYSGKIRLVFSGLDETQWRFDSTARQSFRDAYDLEEDVIAIGLLGMISERKGLHFLIEAFEALLAVAKRPVKLFIVGTAPPQYESFHRHWKTEVERRKLSEHIVWTGQVDNMASVYSGLDIVVNSTIDKYSEPLGTTIYEGMACERVVLATRTGGSPEIVTDGEDGFLCRPDSAQSLTERLAYILEKWDDLSPLRQAARQKVLRHFTVTSTANGYNRVYDELLSQGH